MELSVGKSVLLLLTIPLWSNGFSAVKRHKPRAKPKTPETIVSMNMVPPQSSLFPAIDKFKTINSPWKRYAEHSGTKAVSSRHSASDWLYNVRSIPQSGILKEIRSPVLAVAGWSFAVSAVHGLFARSSHAVLKNISVRLCIPGTPHSLLVSALGLLLVFRTNSSYQRFYEGRKIWESILNVSRNLSRMIELFSEEVGKERKKRLLNLVAAFPYLLRHHIRPGCLCEVPVNIAQENRLFIQEHAELPVDARYEGYKPGPDSQEDTPKPCWVDKRKLPWTLFDSKTLEKISHAKNRPLWVCDRLGKEIMAIPFGPEFSNRERMTFLAMIDKLTDAMGKCERIRQTAVPLNYARHSLRSLTLWLFTLPFALVKDMGLLTAPVTVCTAWLLYGIYQIGYSIEDPFQGSLRLSILCDAIRNDVLGQDSDEGRLSAYGGEDLWGYPTEKFDGEKAKKIGQVLDHTNLVPPVSDKAVETLLRETSKINTRPKILEPLGGIDAAPSVWNVLSNS